MTISASLAMDAMYRRQRHVYDATRKYYLLGRDRMIRGLMPKDGGPVLEIGCGTGRNLLFAARRFPTARFYGIDVSREMLTTAEAAIRQAKADGRIQIAYADAVTFQPSAFWPQPKFERIFISYALSMIPEWRAVISRAMTLLTENGELHIVDFGTQERLPLWSKSALRGWLAAFHVTPVDELENYLRVTFGARVRLQQIYRGYAQIAIVKAWTASPGACNVCVTDL